MEFTRRNLIVGATVASSVIAASSVSACSPPNFEVYDQPAKFFAKVAAGRAVEARAELTPNATLSLVTSEGAQFFTGREDVARIVDRLLGAEGFTMIGDTRSNKAGGMYWEPMGPWLCSDMVKGTVPQFEMNDCGKDWLRQSVLNVFVGIDYSQTGLIKSILVLENRSLSGQLINHGGLPPPPIEE